ncbi:hypothetical protein PT2222_110183 [Paraburkholderia tropica]
MLMQNLRKLSEMALAPFGRARFLTLVSIRRDVTSNRKVERTTRC